MLGDRRQYKERRRHKLWRHRIVRVLLFLLALLILFLLHFASQSTKQTNAMINGISECRNDTFRNFIIQNRPGLNCGKTGEMIILLKKNYDKTLTRQIAEIQIAGAGDEGIREVWE